MLVIAGGIILAVIILRFWEEIAALAIVGGALLAVGVIAILVISFLQEAAQNRRVNQETKVAATKSQVSIPVKQAPQSPTHSKPWSQATQDAVDTARAERERREAEASRSYPTVRMQVPPAYRLYVSEAATEYNLPEALLYAVMSVESEADAGEESSRREYGILRLSPEIAKAMYVTDVSDPRQNIFGGARYLRVLANEYEGDLRKTLDVYATGVLRQGGGVASEQGSREFVTRVLERYGSLKAAAPSR